MSPTPSGSLALQCVELSHVLEIHNGIIFGFYLGLPHIILSWCIKCLWHWVLLSDVSQVVKFRILIYSLFLLWVRFWDCLPPLLPGESVSLETQNGLLALLAYYGVGNRWKGDSTVQQRQHARSNETTELEAHDGGEEGVEEVDLLELKEMEEERMSSSDSSTDGMCYVALCQDLLTAAFVCLQYYQHVLACSTSAARISCSMGWLLCYLVSQCDSEFIIGWEMAWPFWIVCTVPILTSILTLSSSWV